MLELIGDMNSYLQTDPEEFETIILVSINNKYYMFAKN